MFRKGRDNRSSLWLVTPLGNAFNNKDVPGESEQKLALLFLHSTSFLVYDSCDFMYCIIDSAEPKTHRFSVATRSLEMVRLLILYCTGLVFIFVQNLNA